MTVDERKKESQDELYQKFLRGSEILAVVLNVMQVSENVIILTIRFCKVITG